MHLQVEKPYLGVVVEDARVNERILKRLKQIVEIPAPPVGRIAIRDEADRPDELRIKPAEAAHDHHPVLPPFPTYQHLVTDVSIIAIDRRRPGEVEGDAFAHRAHGAAPVAAAPVAGVAAGAAAGAACAPAFAA